MGITKRRPDVSAWTSVEGQGHGHSQAALPEVNAVCCEGNCGCLGQSKRRTQKEARVPGPGREMPSARRRHKCSYKPNRHLV